MEWILVDTAHTVVVVVVVVVVAAAAAVVVVHAEEGYVGLLGRFSRKKEGISLFGSYAMAVV